MATGARIAADMLVATDTATQRARRLSALSALELAELDVELGGRAIKLGRPGFITRTHEAVRIALAAARKA